MPHCETCALVQRRDDGNAPLWDRIVRTELVDVVHSFNTSLPGWIVIVLRRHVAALHELSEAEALVVGRLVRDLSRALRELTGCEKTYVMQFAESPGHSHVHVHVVPRMADLAEQHRGPGIFAFSGVDERARVSEDAMNTLALALQQWLLEHTDSTYGETLQNGR